MEVQRRSVDLYKRRRGGSVNLSANPVTKSEIMLIKVIIFARSVLGLWVIDCIGEAMLGKTARASIFLIGLLLSGCITTSMQGYADRDLPVRPIKNIASYVVAPVALAASLQSGIREEAKASGIFSQDAFALLPPTRTYTDTEIRKLLNESGIDAVLIVNVGDTGVIKEYAGTIFQSQYTGTSEASGMVTRNGSMANVSLSGSSSGTMTSTATPINRYSRQTNFNARLVDVTTGRNLWVGSGQVNAGGALFTGNGANASQTATAIFGDLRTKKIIGQTS